ncbi:MAG: hypothetical protein LH630_01595 [Actinomycetia bacterium]|nr:hypothetical protein [Actinomycetes bacterium]
MLPSTPFAKAEVLDLGIRNREWRSLVSEDLVREVYPGCFVDASLPDTVQLRLAIASRILSPELVAARRTAAWLHGLDLLDYRGFPRTPPLEVVTHRQELRSKSSLLTTHVADDLLPADVMTVGDLQVTTPMRTAADLARFAPRPDALVAADALLNKELVVPEACLKSLVRWRRRYGVRQAYEIADLADGRSESGGESRLRLRVIDMGLPRPELQLPVYDLFGECRFRLDVGWKNWMLALEHDGEKFHGPEQQEHIFPTSQAFEREMDRLVGVARGRLGTLGA